MELFKGKIPTSWEIFF